MKVSVITVVYNGAKTIESAINSVLYQTYNDIEYIVIDGQSTDGTMAIVNKYSSSIKTIISEKDEGLYDAMNKGIKHAAGDVIAFLNSDDVYQDERVVADMAAAFESDTDIHLVYGNVFYVKTDDINHVVRRWNSRAYFDGFFERGNVPPHPSLFVKREVYQACGMFDLNYKLAADYDFMLRAFKRFGDRSKYISRLVVRMRLGGATNKNLKNIIAGNKEIIRSWRKNKLKMPFLMVPLKLLKKTIQFI